MELTLDQSTHPVPVGSTFRVRSNGSHVLVRHSNDEPCDLTGAVVIADPFPHGAVVQVDAPTRVGASFVLACSLSGHCENGAQCRIVGA